MRLRTHPSRESVVSVPSFARGGEFASLPDPFRAPIGIASAGPGAVVLRTVLSAAHGGSTIPVHWEIAREPSFVTPERYGLLLAHERMAFEVEVSLHGLERGRSYWARLWAGGTWSRAVRVRTGPRANGSSSLALRFARLRPPHVARALRP
jgi:phosphodiesterase/alkaline phosphatase D-like protein